MGGGGGVDEATEGVVSGLAGGFALRLREWDEVRGAAEGVEAEDGVLGREAKVGGDLRGELGAGGLLFQELGVDGGRRTLRGGGVGVAGLVFLLPALGGGEIDESERDLFGFTAALCREIADAVAGNGVADDELVGAVFEDEAGAVRELGRGGGGRLIAVGELGGRGCDEEGRGDKESGHPLPPGSMQSTSSKRVKSGLHVQGIRREDAGFWTRHLHGT